MSQISTKRKLRRLNSFKQSDQITFVDFQQDQNDSVDGYDRKLHSSLSRLKKLKSDKQDYNRKGTVVGFARKQDNFMLTSVVEDKNEIANLSQKKQTRKFQIFDEDEEKAPRPFFQPIKCKDAINPETPMESRLLQSVESSLQQLNLKCEQLTKSHHQISEQNSSKSKKSKLIFDIEIDSDQSENEKKQDIKKEEQQISEVTYFEDDTNVQISSPSVHIDSLSKKLAQKISTFQKKQNIRIFLNTPVPNGVYLDLQVHKFKNFMKTQYELWLQHGDALSLFASAVNNKLQIDKTSFTIRTKTNRKKTEDSKSQDSFLGELVSNFKRDTFTLFDSADYTNSRPSGKVICTVVVKPNFTNPKTKSEDLYIPKIIQNEPSIIHNTCLTNNLKKLHNVKEFEKVSKLTTHNASQDLIKKVKQEFKVVSNTTRNAVVRDESKRDRLFFLKMQQDRFKVRVGPGLSPLQVLVYSAVHLE